MKRFFDQHGNDCELSSLSDKHYDKLIRLCLTSDNVLIGGGNAYKQNSGLAMGNNLASTYHLHE